MATEGNKWPKGVRAAIGDTVKLGKSNRWMARTTTLDHLSSANYAIKPD